MHGLTQSTNVTRRILTKLLVQFEIERAHAELFDQ
jgi:hypothetical protein